MKATLYEALGILPTSSDEDVRASLRRLIRKYYAKTRDGQGNVEEALRFINHASRILSDPDRRHRYDGELAVSTGSTEQRIAHVVNNAVAEAGEQTDVGELAEPPVRPTPEAMDADLETGLDMDEPAAELSHHHPGLTEKVASFGRSPIITIGLCALFGTFIASAIAFVTPADTILVAKQVLVWLTITLLVLTIVYGVVHGIAFMRRRSGAPQPVLLPQTDLAILNWRREKSVFLGTNQPQEDASWIFQLRMAELERAKSGRTSEPRPWQRLAARLFDYAIWGLVLALLLSELRALGFGPEGLSYWLGHPLIAPILITGSWVPVEALLIASLGTTPGKWLFGVFLQFSISDAYARRDTQAQLQRAMRAGIPRLVGRRCLWLSAAGAGTDCRRVRKDRAEPGNGLGLRAGRPGDARTTRRAQYDHRRVRARRDAMALRCRVASTDGGVDRMGAHDDCRCVAVGKHSFGGLRRWRRSDQRQAATAARGGFPQRYGESPGIHARVPGCSGRRRRPMRHLSTSTWRHCSPNAVRRSPW